MPWRRTALLFAFLLTLTSASCVTHLYRLGEPAAVERVGLDAEADDLLLVDVVHGLFPRHQESLVLAVPHGWETAAVTQRTDGHLELAAPLVLRWSRVATDRELLFSRRNTDRWSTEARARHRLLRSDELPQEATRTYAVQNLRRADGSIDLELHARCGTDAASRVLGTVPLPADLTPAEPSTLTTVLLTPPLAVIDVAWVPITAAGFVVLIPFGSLGYLFASEPEDLEPWERGG